MDYNPSHKYLGKCLAKTIRVIHNIGSTTPLDSNTITPENLGATIEQMDHEFPNIHPKICFRCFHIFQDQKISRL